MRPYPVRTMLFLLALAVLVSVAFLRAEKLFVQRAVQDAENVLRLVVDAVDQSVERYEVLPRLAADDPMLKDLLRDTGNAGLVPFINEKLRLMTTSLGVSDIYLMDTHGTTVATSNYREDTSFLGRSFAYRPYFSKALGGEDANFHALGTMSGKRGFYFAAPVLDGIDVVGVLVIKTTVSDIEAAWAGSGRKIIVANPDGIAFLASSETYRLRPLAPLNDGQRARIEATRQFPLEQLEPLPMSARVSGSEVVEVMLGDAGASVAYLSVSAPLALAGWHGIVLVPLSGVRIRALYVVGVLVLLLAAIVLTALLFHQRRNRLHDLEVKVGERTADLDTANETLRLEVRERRHTEDRLRRSQKELIQAGKLAALGKMSAALSHEINQPLAAVKSYADNAAQFLERGRTDEVGENIARISEMADRMARISKHLRGFARQPGTKLRSFAVHETVAKAIEIAAPQMRSKGLVARLRPLDPDVQGFGGALRLQQVVLNLLDNATDAMADSAHREIDVFVTPGANTVAITVRDHGPGVPDETLDQVFEAFFTTKEAGVGMGLGLSISYNIIEDFGGRLEVANHAEGGAVFTIVLRRLPADTEEGAIAP